MLPEKDSETQLLLERLVVKKELVAACIYDLNKIIPFPISVNEIEDWSATVLRLRPNVQPEIMRDIMDKFLTGEWHYDKDMGITNIIKAIDEYMSDTPANYIRPC